MSEAYDESVVQALVLIRLGKQPDTGMGEFNAKVAWCALGDCPERREADRRVALLEPPEPTQPPKEGEP
jgi:hypothetical protein